MNNLPLQPLVWSRALTAQSAFHQYLVRKDDEATKRSKSQYVVNYGRLNAQKSMNVATGFATIDEAKSWAWNHYNEKMQPYVKPMPTWIDVNKQLPSHHQDVIVYRYNDNDGGNIEHSLYFDGQVMVGFGNVADEEGFFDDVYYWQPIEIKALYEAMAMQLQIKGERL